MRKIVSSAASILFVLVIASTAWSQSMQLKAYEKTLGSFTDSVLKEALPDYAEIKTQLIEDLYRTEYIDDFYAKYESIARYSRSLSFDIEKRLAACQSADEFKAVKDRYAEWNDFCLMADHAPEDMQKGLIQEYIMDKQREGKPPYEITGAKWEPVDEQSPEIEAYTKELGKAEKTVKKAIAALEKKNEDGFAEQFPKKLQLFRMAEPEESELHALYSSELSNYWKEDQSTDIAPLFIRADLKEAATLYKNEGKIKAVIRRWKKDQAKVAAVILEKNDDKGYVITQWATGSFDMQNRKR